MSKKELSFPHFQPIPLVGPVRGLEESSNYLSYGNPILH